MTLTATRTVVKKRAFPVVMTILLGFLGVSAMAGGLALLLDLDGTRPPISWLDEVPVVDSYLIPGLVLGVGFGVVSIVTTYGMIRRPRWKVGRRARTRQPPSLVVDRDHPPRRRTSCLDWP